MKPTKDFLDAISKDVPICVTRSCGHSMSCNTKALQLASMNESKDGIVEEMDINVVHEAWPKVDESTLIDYIQKGIACANAFGVTTVMIFYLSATAMNCRSIHLKSCHIRKR